MVISELCDVRRLRINGFQVQRHENLYEIQSSGTGEKIVEAVIKDNTVEIYKGERIVNGGCGEIYITAEEKKIKVKNKDDVIWSS